MHQPTAQDPEIARLLSQGGWELVPAAMKRERYGPEFPLPSEEELQEIGPGDCVSIIMRVVDIAEPARDGYGPYNREGQPVFSPGTEGMWVVVEQMLEQSCICSLLSYPWASHVSLVPGSRIECRLEHIVEIGQEDGYERLQARRDAGYCDRELVESIIPVDSTRIRSITQEQGVMCQELGVIPERPWEMTCVLVSRSLNVHDVLYGMRDSYNREGHNGWLVWSGNPDIEQHHFRIMTMRDFDVEYPELRRFMALPTGWRFAVHEEHTDIYFDEDIEC